MEEEFYILEMAMEGYQNVFDTLVAKPTAIKPILPEKIGSKVEEFRPIASDEHLFNELSYTYTNQTTAPLEVNDESIWRIDNARDIPKEQSMKDETYYIMTPYVNPYNFDRGTNGEGGASFPGSPGDFDNDYSKNNFYRKFSGVDKVLEAIHRTYTRPVFVKSAAVWTDIISNLNNSIVKSSQDCTVRLKKADPKKGRWTFAVKSSKSLDTHIVHIKVEPKKGSKKVQSMDIKMGCSCNFWKWQGPDFHAQKQGYLDKTPKSNGSPPNVKDPNSQNKVCKHVYAASSLFLGYSIPKTASILDSPIKVKLRSIGLRLANLQQVGIVKSNTLSYKTIKEIFDLSCNL